MGSDSGGYDNTEENGEFWMIGVRPGKTYTVEVKQGAWSALLARVGGVAVGTENLVIPISKIAGIVRDTDTGQPIPNAKIQAVKREDGLGDPSRSHPTEPTTDENGSFEILIGQPGTYRMAAMKEGYDSHEFTITVPSESPPIEIALGKAKTAIRAKVLFEGEPFPMDKRSGFYRFLDGYICPLPFQPVADEECVYIITGIKSGEMRISARTRDDQGCLRCYPQSVSIEEGEEEELTFNLRHVVVYKVTLNTPDSREITGDLDIEILDFPQADASSEVSWRSGNEFRIELPTGRYRVQLKAPGYQAVEFIPADIVEPSPAAGFGDVTVDLQPE
ncbi:MAG: carboxypeptidase regulatory-like domain-containing protein [bacterium]